MNIKYHKKFLKNYKFRIEPYPKIKKQFRERLNAFIANPQDPLLKDHKLTGGLKNFRSFSVSGDIRIIYQIVNNSLLIYDVGSHNQVY